MDQKHKTWAIRAGVGGAVCALLTVWMVPNTKPTNRPSVIAGMAGTAEAQKPTYSAVPDSAIPSWAAGLQQAPAAARAAVTPPMQVADAGPMPDAESADSPPDSDRRADVDQPPATDDAPPPVARTDTPPPPAVALQSPRDDYQARRAEWQAQIDATMAGQRGPS